MNRTIDTFAPPTVNPPSPRARLVLSIDDFYGPASKRCSDWAAMRAALEACTKREASMLILPRRVYRFDDPEILARKEEHIEMQDLADLVIDGQGSELFFHHIKGGFRLRNCQRVVLRRMTVDWDVNLASPGVVQVQKDGRHAVLIDERYPLAGKALAAGVSEYDTDTMHWKMNGVEVCYPVNCAELAPQLIHSPSFEENREPPFGQGGLKDGMQMAVRHWVYGSETQEAPAFNCDGPGNEDIAFEDITIYQCPGHAFVGYGCERGIRLSRNRIERRRDKNYLISATADGAHFGTMRGDLIIEDCDFSHHGDDSVNIHGIWMTVAEKIDARTFRLTSNWANWHVRVERGDVLKICKQSNAQDLAPLLRIAAVELEKPEQSQSEEGATLHELLGREKSPKVFIVSVDNDLPEAMQPGDLVANLSRAVSGFVIRNNYFHDHRARGMIIQATDGLIENNHIKNTMGSGFHLTSNIGFWKEGYGVHRVILRGNLIEGCNYAMWERGPIGRNMAAVSLSVDTPEGIGDAPGHREVLLEGNTVRDTPGLAFQISSAQGVVLRENRIEDSNLEPFQNTGSACGDTADGSIMVHKASDVEIVGNRLRNTRKTHATRIYVSNSSKNVRLADNNGFE